MSNKRTGNDLNGRCVKKRLALDDDHSLPEPWGRLRQKLHPAKFHRNQVGVEGQYSGGTSNVKKTKKGIVYRLRRLVLIRGMRGSSSARQQTNPRASHE